MISADGRVVGEIGALFLLADGNGLRVDALRVKLRKDIAEELGVKKTMMHAATVEIPASSIQSVGDAVVLTVPIQHLRADAASEGTVPHEPDVRQPARGERGEVSAPPMRKPEPAH